MRSLLIPLLVFVALGACGGDDDTTDPASDTAPTTLPTSTSAPLTTSTETIVIADTDPPTTVPAAPGGGSTDEELAIADLAARQDVVPAAITTVSVENVTWRDGSIGCPEPGVNDIQVLTDGVRVILELDGVRYQYHSGGSQTVFLCEDPQPPVGE